MLVQGELSSSTNPEVTLIMRDTVPMLAGGRPYMRLGNICLPHACQTRRVCTDYSLWYDLAAQVD